MSVINNPIIRPLIKSAQVRTYAKDQTILYPNDENLSLYVIKDGAVAMENISEAGERKILNIFGVSTLFPMVSFMERRVTSPWFYTALVDTQVYLISYSDLTEVLKKTDGFTAYNALLKQLLVEMHELLLHISDHTKTDSTEKLISMLLFLLAHHTKQTSDPWREVRFPVTHQFLADLTGLTRETVSITLKEFTKHKLVRYREKGKLELNYSHLSKEHHS